MAFSQKIALVTTLLLTTLATQAADRFNLSFFSIVPPSNWRVETDKEYRLLASRSGTEHPPFLIVEACEASKNQSCPSNCDLPAMVRSKFVSDLHLSLKVVKRRDSYLEYAASSKQTDADGEFSPSVRMLCGPGGSIYVALIEDDKSDNADKTLDTIINSIEWKK